MGVDLEGKIGKVYGLIQRAKSLRNNVIGYWGTQLFYADSRMLETYFEIYDKIRNDVIGLFPSDKTVHSLPYLGVVKRLDKDELLRIVAGLDQITSFLEGKEIDVLGTTVRTFPYEEKEMDVLPSTTRLLLLEAIAEYNHFHSYACCCICGLAFESIVKEGCKKNNLAYEGLARGVKALKETEVIKEDLHKTLMDLEKYYRDKISAHLTSEVATDEKARLFLSSLLSLAKAIFPTR